MADAQRDGDAAEETSRSDSSGADVEDKDVTSPAGTGEERRERVRQQTATPVTQQIGRAVVVIATILFGVFAAFNLQSVTFNWIFGGTEVVEQGGEYVSGGVPLILLLIAAFVLGAIAGAGVVWRRHRQHRAGGRAADDAG